MAKLERATRGSNPDREILAKVMQGVVQIVALKQGFMGQMSPAWTGSGTIVDPSGLILTNCHVANPRALGMSAPAADVLAVAVTQRSDDPPAITYIAQVAAQAPELDLAVLRIVAGADGRPVKGLSLPFVPLGDSDTLELGDVLSIFGYPGIGGETVTFTSGSVAGFTSEQHINDRRAWIKTDATIAGGNSGGTAVNDDGYLVGVPTQAAAGAGVTPVDARPVVDTNRDGRIDQRDTPMAIGGFINGLRPVNLAKPLLAQAGYRGATGATAPQPSAPARPSVVPPAPAPAAPKAAGPRVANLVFCTQVTADGRPINPAAILPSGGKSIFASFEYQGFQNGLAWSQVWTMNGNPVVQNQGQWTDGASGRKTLNLSNRDGLPDATYQLIITVNNQVVGQGEVVIGRRVDDTDTEVSGQVVDSETGRGISEALVIVLNPGVSVQQFLQTQRKELAFTSARTGANGQFTFPKQLPKGQAYGLIVVARGYRDMAIESALRVTANAPEHAQINPIALQPE